MSRTNETRHIIWHKTCKCKCRLDASACNNIQRWRMTNADICRCRCEGKDNWNLSNCECECDKSCDIGEYLDYKNCKYRERIIDKLVEECSENFYENETIDVIPLNVYKKVGNSCMVYIVLFVIFLMTSICICSIFIYFH